MTEATQALLPVTPELLPCPFCEGRCQTKGSPATNSGYWVVCRVCGTKGPVKADVPKAITAWNSRISHSIPGDVGTVIEVERDPDGHAMICTGCGTVETLASIKARSETAFSCCPERKMVRAVPSEGQRRGYDDVSIDHALRSALRFAASRSAITAKDEQAILASFAALTPSPCPGDVGTVSASILEASWDIAFATFPESPDAFKAGVLAARIQGQFAALCDGMTRAEVHTHLDMVEAHDARAALPSHPGDAGEGELVTALRKYSRSQILTTDLRRVLADAANALGAK